MTKHLDKDQIELEITALEAIFDGDPERLRVALHDLGFLNNPQKVDAEQLMEHVKTVGGWYMEDREVTVDSARVMAAIAAVSDPRSEFYRLMRRENLPANELMGRRMESGVLAVLGPARGDAQLVPDRARVVVRGPARHPARRAGVGLLRVARREARAAVRRARDLETLGASRRWLPPCPARDLGRQADRGPRRRQLRSPDAEAQLAGHQAGRPGPW